MKKSVKIILGMLIVIVFVGLNSCDKTSNDPPSTDTRAQYVGSWTCTESALVNYPVTITLDTSNSSQILIHNFHLLGTTSKAYAIATQNNLTLPTQAILSYTIHGSGDLVNGNKITMKYYVNNLTDIDTINAVYTK